MENGVLMIPSERLLDGELAEILADPRVVNLKELNLHNNALTAESARLIADSPKLVGLEILDLSFNPIADEGVATLAGSAQLESVRIFSVARVGASGRTARALAASSQAAGVADLDLRYQQIGPDAALLIGKRQVLRLTKTGIDGPTAVALLRAAEVQTLELSENAIGSLTDLDAIRAAIMNLDLNHCELSDISALAQATAPGLEALELDYNPLGDAGLGALTTARWLQQLKFLSVVGTKGSPAARQALRSAWGQRPGLTIDADHAN
jgi:hypothetical protein